MLLTVLRDLLPVLGLGAATGARRRELAGLVGVGRLWLVVWLVALLYGGSPSSVAVVTRATVADGASAPDDTFRTVTGPTPSRGDPPASLTDRRIVEAVEAAMPTT